MQQGHGFTLNLPSENSPLLSVESSPTLRGIEDMNQQDLSSNKSTNMDRNDQTNLNVEENSFVESCNVSTCGDQDEFKEDYKEDYDDEVDDTIVEEEEIQSDDDASPTSLKGAGVTLKQQEINDYLNQLSSAPLSNPSFKHLRLNPQDLHFHNRLSPNSLNSSPTLQSNTLNTLNSNKLIVLASNKQQQQHNSQLSTPTTLSYMMKSSMYSKPTTSATTTNTNSPTLSANNSGMNTLNSSSNNNTNNRAKRSSSNPSMNQQHQYHQFEKQSSPPPPPSLLNVSSNVNSNSSTPTLLISKSKKSNNQTITTMTTENTIFSSKYFVRNWDTTPQHVTRMKQLSELHDHFVNLPYKDLELKLKSDLLLIYNRIIGYFQLNYLHMKDLAIQIKCIGLFIQGYKPLLEFIEIGGTQILLEVLGFHYYKTENEDKKEALLVLTSIANNGRKYKEVICFDNGLELLRKTIVYIPSIDINSIAKNFLVSIYQGNPKHSNEILELLFEVFRNHSSPYNWKTISAHISANNTPRSRRSSFHVSNTGTSGSGGDDAFASPRSMFNSPRPFGNFLNTFMSPRTPSGGGGGFGGGVGNKNISPSSSISFQPPLATPKNLETPKAPPFNKLTFLSVAETARNQLLTTDDFRKSVDINNGMSDPSSSESIDLSTQSILLIYSMIKEISKSVKIEQIRETKVLDIIFMNFSDEEIRVVRESVDMVKIAMQYPDENDIFAEMLIHRSLQGLSMISIVLGKRRFKSILKQFFKNSSAPATASNAIPQHSGTTTTNTTNTTTNTTNANANGNGTNNTTSGQGGQGSNHSKEEINYAKNFLNLIFGACSVMNLILANATEHVNICKIMYESNIILTLIESILIIKEKYGDTNYSVDTSKEVTQLLRRLLWTFEDFKSLNIFNNSTILTNPYELLVQIFGEETTQKLNSKYESFNTDQSFFLQDSIQRTNVEQARQLIVSKKQTISSSSATTTTIK